MGHNIHFNLDYGLGFVTACPVRRGGQGGFKL